MPSPASDRRHRVLIVDDEAKICELLCAFLKKKHDVTSCACIKDAQACITGEPFDLIVTDLKLPDGNGLELLKAAKALDPLVEVIIITGYASLDTATAAVNLGVSSYLTKPISLATLAGQVDRAAANRDFHLRSRSLMERSEGLDTSARRHLLNITSIYDLSRRLMLTIDVADIMRIVLVDLNEKMDAAMAVVGISLFGESEIFAMPRRGAPPAEAIHALLSARWPELFEVLDPADFQQDRISLMPFEGGSGDTPLTDNLIARTTPLIAGGKTIGVIALFMDAGHSPSEEEGQFLHVFSSLIAPLVENAYVHKRTKSQASTDPLTGIANHRSFQEMLSREIARSNRDKSDFCLLILDIDDFKKVNDTYGHLTGDAILREMTQHVNNSIRLGDMLARYGGEEFTVILPSTGLDGAFSLAERIRKQIASHPYSYYGKEIPYTVSIGLSCYSGKAPQSKEDLIRLADEALYVSKREGKNRLTAR